MKNFAVIRILALLFSVALVVILSSCSSDNSKKNKAKLTIFHAGSLSIPIKEISEKFEAIHPNVDVLLESSGSVSAIRKITDLNRSCDVIVLADEALIETWLIPDFASWNLHFASNEIVIAYNDGSRYSDEINDQNWYQVVARSDVRYGRSDPNSDPCGYRTELTMKLANQYYSGGVDYMFLLAKDKNYIRPKASDLVALLETASVDYIFEYISVAKQHGFKIVHLPDHINLSNPELLEEYASVDVKILGKKPGETIMLKGNAMVYGLTIPFVATEVELAEEFVAFFMQADKGMDILMKHGQKILKPKYSESSTKKPIFESK